MELVIYFCLLPVVMLPMLITAFFLKDLGAAIMEGRAPQPGGRSQYSQIS